MTKCMTRLPKAWVSCGKKGRQKMTVKEWREQNPETSHTMVWAADAGSFGRKGHSMYGSREVTGRLEIIRIEMTQLKYPEYAPV